MENIGQLIKQISNILINDLNKRLKYYDITFSQLQVLLVIKENNNNICQKDIANVLKIKHTSLIDVIKILERKELIIKNAREDNAKFSEISLTIKAKEIIDNLDLGKDKTQEMMASILGFSNVDEMLCKFKELLNKLEENEVIEVEGKKNIGKEKAETLKI